MDSKEVAILGENDVLLDVAITEYGAEILEIARLAYALGEASSVWSQGIGADEEAEERAGLVVEPVDDELWEKEDGDVEGALEDDEDEAEEEGDVLVRAQTREKGKVRHGRGRDGGDVRAGRSRPGDPCVCVVFLAWLSAVYGSSCPHRPCPLLLVLPLTSPIMRPGLAQRAPSPTNTAFSGISSYRTDPYKPFRDKSSISSPPVDSYQVARTHYDELSKYLASYLAKGALSPPSPFTSLHPVAHHHPRFRTCKFPLNSTTETHEANTPAIPGIIYRCLR